MEAQESMSRRVEAKAKFEQDKKFAVTINGKEITIDLASAPESDVTVPSVSAIEGGAGGVVVFKEAAPDAYEARMDKTLGKEYAFDLGGEEARLVVDESADNVRVHVTARDSGLDAWYELPE